MRIMPISCSLKRNNDSTVNKTKFRNTNNVDTVSFSANRLHSEEIKKLAQEATQWWCKKLAGGYKFDNGESETAAKLVASKALNGVPDSVKVTREQIAKFRETLQASLEKEIDEAGQGKERWETTVDMGVDYHPHLTLADALKQAGFNDKEIDYSCLPTKTGMHIDTQKRIIEVSDGYAKPYETIFELLKN